MLWEEDSENKDGRLFTNVLISNFLGQLISEPPHVCNDSLSFIDSICTDQLFIGSLVFSDILDYVKWFRIQEKSPIFWRNSNWPRFGHKWQKMAENSLFNIFSKLTHYWKCWTLWLGCMVHHPYIWKNPRLDKCWAKRPESSQPI